MSSHINGQLIYVTVTSQSSLGMFHRKNIPEAMQRRITKYFVSNLPERCSGSELAEFVRGFGFIYDLYIAKKRNKEGKRFGFVSMLDLKDKEEMGKRLSEIRMGEFRLCFNVARFVLEEGEFQIPEKDGGDQANGRSKGAVNGSNHDNVWNRKTFSGGNGDRSFKEILMDKKSELATGKKVFIQDSVKAFVSLHGKAIVVRLDNVKALLQVKNLCRELGVLHGRFQYLGGLSVLVSVDEEEDVNSLLNAGVKVGGISQVSVWEGQSLGFERLAWLRVQGIPLHILTNEVIDVVGGLFGMVVHKAERLESDGDLSYEYVGVLVGEGGRLSEEVVVHWKDRKFRVWVTEETRDWLPDFLEDDQSEESEGSSDESGAVPPVGGVAGMVPENFQNEVGQSSKSETEDTLNPINSSHLSGENVKEDLAVSEKS